MCIYNNLIENPKYKENKKNGGVIPPVLDKRVLYVPIGCGNCIECRKQKAREWQVRLLEDIKEHRNGKFITLTFSNESIKQLDSELDEWLYRINENKAKRGVTTKEFEIPTGYKRDNEIAKMGIRRFLERWRKEHKKSIRHWLITELGHNGTENIHLHGIIWTNESYKEIHKHWAYGYIWPRPSEEKTTYVGEATVNYITKYVHKMDEIHKYYKPKILTSSGIGENYTKTLNFKLNKFEGENTDETYKTRTGHKLTLPIYYRNKIYTDEEKEKLWINKLNKEERWVCGEKVTEEEYYATVQYYRKINKELGYGTNRKNWEDEEYENRRREILRITRIANTPNPS